jgi:hypothetical protein
MPSFGSIDIYTNIQTTYRTLSTDHAAHSHLLAQHQGHSTNSHCLKTSLPNHVLNLTSTQDHGPHQDRHPNRRRNLRNQQNSQVSTTIALPDFHSLDPKTPSDHSFLASEPPNAATTVPTHPNALGTAISASWRHRHVGAWHRDRQ